MNAPGLYSTGSERYDHAWIPGVLLNYSLDLLSRSQTLPGQGLDLMSSKAVAAALTLSAEDFKI